MAPYTVYQPRNKITYAKDGDWVRAVIDRRAPQPGVYRHKNKARSYVDWTDRELHDKNDSSVRPVLLQMGIQTCQQTKTQRLPRQAPGSAGHGRCRQAGSPTDENRQGPRRIAWCAAGMVNFSHT